MCTDNNTLKKRFLNPTPDVGVNYTGPDIPALGIINDECNDLRVSDIEAIIIAKLLDYAEGKGISLPTITGNCAFVTEFLATSDKSLANLIQGLFNFQCSLNAYIQAVEQKLEPPFPFDLKCLEPNLPATPSRNQIIQALIDLECSNKTRLDIIEEDLGNVEDPQAGIVTTINQIVGTLVGQILSSCQGQFIVTGQGADTKIQMIGGNPIGTILYGKFDTSSFTDTGLGLAEKGMCGWAIANGNNGTEDVRGFALAATINGPGPALNTIVLPNQDVEFAANYLTRKGKNKLTLNSSQLPDHEHNTLETPHTHNYNDNRIVGSGDGNAFPTEGLDQGGSVKVANTTLSTTATATGLQVKGVKGTVGQPIDMRQPTFYARAIQRIA